jgi:hypothetical protein
MSAGPSDKDPSSTTKKVRPNFPAQSDYDIGDHLKSLVVKSREMPKEMAARLLEEKDQADHERWMEKIKLLAAIFSLTIVGGACLFLALRPEQSEDKKWAMSILSAIVTYGVCNAGKRSSKSE